MRRPEAEPKPFALIPVPQEPPNRDKATTHERFSGLTGQLELALTVVSEYLFVGSGEHEFDPQARGDRPDVWHTFYRHNGQICIPGTSLKGAIRSILEAISNSCVSLSRRHEVELTRLDRAHRERCDSLERLCPACQLFGFTGLRGRVYFKDALPEGNLSPKVVKIPELWHHSPRRIRRLDKARRFYQTGKFQPLASQRPERGYWFVEALPKGSRFLTVLCFENVTQAELGLMLHSLGWCASESSFHQAFPSKIGGVKPLCFGAVRFEPRRMKLWQTGGRPPFLSLKVLGEAELTKFVRDCLNGCQADENLFHKPSWQEMVRGFQPKDKPCPEGIY